MRSIAEINVKRVSTISAKLGANSANKELDKDSIDSKGLLNSFEAARVEQKVDSRFHHLSNQTKNGAL